MSALDRYFKEVRRLEPRPEKLAELLVELEPLGFTQDWVELHRLAWTEHRRLSERVKRLPEVKREQDEVTAQREQERWEGTLAERRKRAAELDARALKLFCEYGILKSEASFRDGLPHVFPLLFQVTDSPGWAVGVWAPVHNFLVERLGINPMEEGPDGKLRTYDIPPQPEKTNYLVE